MSFSKFSVAPLPSEVTRTVVSGGRTVGVGFILWLSGKEEDSIFTVFLAKISVSCKFGVPAVVLWKRSRSPSGVKYA